MEASHALYTQQIFGFIGHDNPSGLRSLKVRQTLRWQKGQGLAMKCCNGDRLMRPDSIRKVEVGEECDGIVDESKDDVKEKVELMEMEAIMGKDDGREPMDYKRRACIFYKSSEVFQAIKDEHHTQQCA